MMQKSYCRICPAGCGILVDVDNNEVVEIRGDLDHPWSRGYTCAKGRAAGNRADHPNRLLRPHMRDTNGVSQPIQWADAIADIAGRLKQIISESGLDSIGLFLGGGAYLDMGSYGLWYELREKLGTRSVYSDLTIDTPAKVFVPELMAGVTGAVAQPDYSRCRLVLLVGTNPAVSHGHTAMITSPTTRLREAGLHGEIWVIDPRPTESAVLADRHLAAAPGSDYAIFAFLIRELLRDGANRDYIETHTQGIDVLTVAVEPYTPEYAAALARVTTSELFDLLAAVRKAGQVTVETGTGVTMSRNANVTQWLAWALMIITKSLDQEGGAWINPGFFTQYDKLNFPPAPEDGWRAPGPTSRPELVSLAGEYPCVALPDEIEAGNLRAILNLSGNLITCLPETDRMTAALEKLDMLVTIEPFRSSTMDVSTHCLPSRTHFERADLAYMDTGCLEVGTQFTPALISPRGDTRPAWWILAKLGEAMGFELASGFDFDNATDKDFASFLSVRGRAPIEIGDEGRCYIASERIYGWVEKTAKSAGGWRLAPRLLVEQLSRAKVEYSLQLINRRQRTRQNSNCCTPDDLAAISISKEDALSAGVVSGDTVIVRSANGEIQGTVKVDPLVTPGIITIPHGWPGMINVNQLTSSVNDVDELTGMPLYSGIVVKLERILSPSPVSRSGLNESFPVA